MSIKWGNGYEWTPDSIKEYEESDDNETENESEDGNDYFLKYSNRCLSGRL